MKRTKRTMGLAGVVVVSVVLGVAISHGTAQQKESLAPAKVAVVDIDSLFRNYKKVKDYNQSQQDESMRLQAEDEARQAGIKKAQNALADLRPGSPDFNRQREAVTKLTIEYQVWRNVQMELQQQLRVQRTKEMYEEMVKVAAVVGRQAGCNLVMTKDPIDLAAARTMDELVDQFNSRKILYAADSLDITDAVLMQLNELYAAKK